MVHLRVPVSEVCVSRRDSAQEFCWKVEEFQDEYSSQDFSQQSFVEARPESYDPDKVDFVELQALRGPLSLKRAFSELGVTWPTDVASYTKVPGLQVKFRRDPDQVFPRDAALAAEMSRLDNFYKPIAFLRPGGEGNPLMVVGADLYVLESEDALSAILSRGDDLRNYWVYYGAVRVFSSPEDVHAITDWELLPPEERETLTRQSEGVIQGIGNYLNNGAPQGLKDYVKANRISFEFKPRENMLAGALAFQEGETVGLSTAVVHYYQSEVSTAQDYVHRVAAHEVGHHEFGLGEAALASLVAVHMTPHVFDETSQGPFFHHHMYAETELHSRLVQFGVLMENFDEALAERDYAKLETYRQEVYEELGGIHSYLQGLAQLPEEISFASLDRIERKIAEKDWVAEPQKAVLINTVREAKLNVSPALASQQFREKGINPYQVQEGMDIMSWYGERAPESCLLPVGALGQYQDFGYFLGGAHIAQYAVDLATMAGFRIRRASSPFLRTCLGGILAGAYEVFVKKDVSVGSFLKEVSLGMLSGFLGGVASRASSLRFFQPIGMQALGSMRKRTFWKGFLFDSPTLSTRTRAIRKIVYGSTPLGDRLSTAFKSKVNTRWRALKGYMTDWAIGSLATGSLSIRIYGSDSLFTFKTIREVSSQYL